MPGIRLYVCCHKKSVVPSHPLLVPVQVGAALTGERLPGCLPDNRGEHISEKNRSYCELTAQYWAWKNEDAEYYGFFHYRRYLYPGVGEKRPYRLEGTPTAALLEKLGYDDLSKLVEGHDLILPMGEDMHLSVRAHYAAAPFHHGKDLALAETILEELHPEMKEAAEEYLSGTVQYFGNLFVMKRQLFFDYCGWLFPLLEEFDRRADTTGYSPQERRVDGYLAERLLGVYCTHRRKELSVLELPRVHFEEDPAVLKKKRLLNGLLPPGSKRRSLIKRWKGS